MITMLVNVKLMQVIVLKIFNNEALPLRYTRMLLTVLDFDFQPLSAEAQKIWIHFYDKIISASPTLHFTDQFPIDASSPSSSFLNTYFLQVWPIKVCDINLLASVVLC